MAVQGKLRVVSGPQRSLMDLLPTPLSHCCVCPFLAESCGPLCVAWAGVPPPTPDLAAQASRSPAHWLSAAPDNPTPAVTRAFSGMQDPVNRPVLFTLAARAGEGKRGGGVEKSQRPQLCCSSEALQEVVSGLGLGPDVFRWVLQGGKRQGLPVTHVCRPRPHKAGVWTQQSSLQWGKRGSTASGAHM